MNQETREELLLFDDPGGELPLSPGELNQLDTQREQWRLRQRRCRTNKRRNKALAQMARNVENARSVGVEAQMEELQAKKREHDERLRELALAESPLLFEWIKSHYGLWAAIFLGGHLATRVFDRTDGSHLPQPLPLIFKAANSLHSRGQRVDTKALDRELKRQGVIMLPYFLELLDDVLSYSYLPTRFTLDDVDNAIEFSKEA